MGKSHILFWLAMLGFVLVACAPSHSPESVGREALAAWYQGDVDKLISLSAPDASRTLATTYLDFCRSHAQGYPCLGFGTQQRVNIKEVVVRRGTGLLGPYVLVTIVFIADGQDGEARIFVEEMEGQWYIRALAGYPEIEVGPRY